MVVFIPDQKMASAMNFLANVRIFINNLNIAIRRIQGNFPHAGMPAVCYTGPVVPDQQGRSMDDLLADIFGPLMLSVPRHRRSIEKRKTRKMSLPLMVNARPKKNIIICLNCGHPHERETICGNCYSKVREETLKMREAMGDDKFKYDHPRQEVGYLYKGENVDNIPMYKGRYLVEIDRERPSWFSKDLLKKYKGET